MNVIGVITYAHPHLKTEQVLLSLYQRGWRNVRVYALPFTQRKNRETLLRHRPDQEDAVAPQVLCEALGYLYIPCEGDTGIDRRCDIYLIAGAGILSPEAVQGKKILNCHPGILPAVRGLDAFKWAIYHLLPVGNTLHYIDQEVDGGEVIAVRQTPLFITDSLATFARRHYEYEIQMLSHFDSFLEAPVNPFSQLVSREPTRRMGIAAEGEMCRKFDEYKERYALRGAALQAEGRQSGSEVF